MAEFWSPTGRPRRWTRRRRSAPPGPSRNAPTRRCSARCAGPNKGNVPKGNTTDPHCRIMPAPTGGYMCARNLQALANDRQIILAMLLHDNPIDVGALHPLLKVGRANLDAIGITRAIGQVLFDAGYASEANFTADCEASLLVAVHNEAATCGRDQAGDKTIPAAWPLGRHGRHDGHARGQRGLQEASGHHRARLRAAVRPHGTKPELVPLENRIRVVTCGSSGYQAARAYSLIRPPKTGFRRIRLRSRPATVRCPPSCLPSGTRWAMPWCGRAVL